MATSLVISVEQFVQLLTSIECAERLRNKSTVDFQLKIKELFDVDHSFFCVITSHICSYDGVLSVPTVRRSLW